MPLAKSIDGSTLAGGWASLAGVQATTGNSGDPTHRFTFVSGSGANWTYRALSPADAAPALISSNGYLESTEGQQCFLQLEAAGTACGANDTHYWLSWWMRGVRTVSGLVASDLASNLCGLVTGGNQALTNLTLNNSTAPTAAGYNFSLSGNLVGTPVPLWDCNASTKSPMMMFGEWYKVEVHFYRENSDGYIELFINGRKVGQSAATDNDSTITWASQNLYLIVPNWAGTQWHIAGPVESWSGTDRPLRPLHSLDAGRPVTKILMPAHATVNTALSQGIDWQWINAGLAVHTEYANTTGSERRRVFVCSSGTPTATTVDNIGDLEFNEQGWATLTFPDFYVPGGSVLITFRNAANNVNLLRVTLANAGGASGTVDLYSLDAAGNTTYMADDIPAAARYSLLLHLNRDGRATWTVLDRSTNLGPATGRGAWSGPLPDWSPQTLGQCALAFGFNTTAINISGLVVASRPAIACLDSMSTTAYDLAVDLRFPYTVCGALPNLEERQCIPNGYWSQREVGMERMHLVTTCGQSGLARRQWSLTVLQGLAYTRGCMFICPDAGVGNDYIASTVGPSTTIATQVAACERSLEQMFDTLLAGDNAIWITTAMKRNRQATVSGISNNGSNKCRIAATGHGIPSAIYFARIVGGTGIAGIDSNTTGLTILAVGDANTFDVDVAYSAPSLVAPVVVPLASTQDDFRIAINEFLRGLVNQKQRDGLVRFSDLDLDMAANPATYPNTLGTNATWGDIVHPQAWAPATALTRGCWIAARRMVQTQGKPPTQVRRDRWPLRLLGR